MMRYTTARRISHRRLMLALTIALIVSFGRDVALAAAADRDTLRIANPVAIVSLDPFGARSADQPTLTVTQEVFEPLVRRQGNDMRPWLATSWENPDNQTWIFHLRTDVRFADGTPFGSADVKASLERLIGQKGPLSGLWASVDRLETPDAATFRIITKQPTGTILSNLSMLGIAPAGKLADPAFFAAPFGTGPFKVTAFTAGESVALARNDSYWGAKAKIGRLEFRYIPEVFGRITALENDEVDFTWAVPADQLDQVRGHDDLKVESFPTFSNYYMWFNSSRPPLNDARVRQAMWSAVDIAEIQKDLFAGSGQVATAPIPPTVFGYAPQTPVAYDVDKAKKLLADAGYPDGFSATMMWSSQCCVNVGEFAETLISYWAKIGIKIAPQELERANWLDRLLKLDWDMTLSDGNTITGDADFTLARLYLSSAHRMGYANPALDTVLLAARSEVDQARRAALYAQAGKIIWDDAVGIFPLDEFGNAVHRVDVRGFVPSPDAMPRFETVSKD